MVKQTVSAKDRNKPALAIINIPRLAQGTLPNRRYSAWCQTVLFKPGVKAFNSIVIRILKPDLRAEFSGKIGAKMQPDECVFD